MYSSTVIFVVQWKICKPGLTSFICLQLFFEKVRKGKRQQKTHNERNGGW